MQCPQCQAENPERARFCTHRNGGRPAADPAEGPGQSDGPRRGAASASGLRSLKQLLIPRTEGTPFLLEESVRTLVESGALSGKRGTYRLARAVPDVQVPATVQAVLAARIDRL